MAQDYVSIMEIIHYYRKTYTEFSDKQHQNTLDYLKEVQLPKVHNHEHMTPDQQQCWLEKELWILLLGVDRPFPGNLSPWREFEARYHRWPDSFSTSEKESSSDFLEETPSTETMETTTSTSMSEASMNARSFRVQKVRLSEAIKRSKAGERFISSPRGMRDKRMAKRSSSSKIGKQAKSESESSSSHPENTTTAAPAPALEDTGYDHIREQELHRQSLYQINDRETAERIEQKLNAGAKETAGFDEQVRASRLARNEVDPLLNGYHQNVVFIPKTPGIEVTFTGEQVKVVQEKIGLKIGFEENNTFWRVWVEASRLACLENKEREKGKLRFAFGMLRFWKWRLEDDEREGKGFTSMREVCEWWLVVGDPRVENWLRETGIEDPRLRDGLTN